jgi:predicted DNA-binding antitoxin AbrB/MazE fold protein
MTVKAVYEDRVLKPKAPLPLKEHEEVEIEVRRTTETATVQQDPRSFVGFIKGEVPGMPVDAHHDKFLDQDQYAYLKAYYRPLLSAPDWNSLSRDEKLQRFIRACKARSDYQDLWEDMDRIPLVWSNAFDYCTQAVERETVARRG